MLRYDETVSPPQPPSVQPLEVTGSRPRGRRLECRSNRLSCHFPLFWIKSSSFHLPLSLPPSSHPSPLLQPTCQGEKQSCSNSARRPEEEEEERKGTDEVLKDTLRAEVSEEVPLEGDDWDRGETMSICDKKLQFQSKVKDKIYSNFSDSVTDLHPQYEDLSTYFVLRKHITATTPRWQDKVIIIIIIIKIIPHW